MTLFKSVMDKCETVLMVLCVLGLAVMLGLGVLTVLFRFVIQSSLAFPDEMIRYLFVWIIALGSAIGLRRNMHAAIGIVVKALPDVPKRAALMFASACVLVFMGIVLKEGWAATQSATAQISPAMEISMAWLFAAVPVGAFFGVLFTSETLIKQATISAADLIVDDT